MKEELEKHKIFFDTMDKLDYPNSGGCLLTAYTFYLYLIKNNLPTEPFRIKQYEGLYENNTIETNVQFLNGMTDRAVSSAHYTWIYNGYEMDACIRRNEELASSITDKFIILPIKDYKLFCENSLINGSWNSLFDRNKSIEIIKDELDIDLSHLKY